MTTNWNSSYSVGNAVLDAQHKKLLALCDEAKTCLEDNSRDSILHIHEILNELRVYAETHFRTEEALLAKRHYRDLDVQLREHQEYSERLTALCYSAIEGEIDKVGLYLYLSGWWQHHILESDMQYKEFLAKSEAVS